MNAGKLNITITFCFSLILFLSFFNSSVCIGSVIKSSTDNSLNSMANKHNLINFFEDNCILNVGGKGPNNYTKIQNAIIASKDGDTIFVWNNSSPYYENIIINKKIKLIGADKNTTIIDGRGEGDVVTVIVDEVYISGFSVINSGRDWLDAGIKLDSDNNRISGNIISNNSFGIYSYDLDNTVISDNIVTDSFDSGIHLPFSNNITISNNTIMNNTLKGIFLYDSNVHCNIRNSISDNTIVNNKEGIYFWFSYRTDIFGNTISNNLNGISFNHNSEYNNINNNIITHNKYDGIFLNSSEHNQLFQNIITQNINGICLRYSSDCDIINNSNIGNNDNGLLINYSSNTYIFDNYFSDNDIYGLYLVHSTKTYIEYNNIINNKKIGIYLDQNSNNNNIKYNNFIDQNTHAFFEDTFSNKWSNNFWDDWDKEGFYRINGRIHLLNRLIRLNWINFDFYPSEYKYS